MDAIKLIFISAIEFPLFIAELLLRFFVFPLLPYFGVISTARLLQKYRLQSLVLLIISYFILALSLGFQNTRDLILTFSGGASDSLQHLAKMNTSGKEFLYLLLFVLGSVVVSLFIGLLLCYTLLRRGKQVVIIKQRRTGIFAVRKNSRKLFLDIYNVFVSFIVGWFVLLAICLSYFKDKVDFQRISGKVGLGEFLKQLGLADVSDALVNYASIAVLIISLYFGFTVVMRLRLQKSRNVSQTIEGEIKTWTGRVGIFVLPALVALTCIFLPVIYLAALSDTFFGRARDFDYQASCVPFNVNKGLPTIFASIYIKNSTPATRLHGPIYLTLWNAQRKKLDDGTFALRPMDSIKIEPANFVWASKKGLFVDSSEARYLRFVVSEDSRFRSSELMGCFVENDSNGGAPKNDHLDYRVPTKVESADALSTSQNVE